MLTTTAWPSLAASGATASFICCGLTASTSRSPTRCQHFGRFQTVHRITLAELGARLAARVDDGDVGRREALFQHAADQRVGHVAAAEEGNFHA